LKCGVFSFFLGKKIKQKLENIENIRKNWRELFFIFFKGMEMKGAMVELIRIGKEP